MSRLNYQFSHDNVQQSVTNHLQFEFSLSNTVGVQFLILYIYSNEKTTTKNDFTFYSKDSLFTVSLAQDAPR